jgi:hypothetical protein
VPFCRRGRVNKLTAIADSPATCDDARAYVKQINYIVNNGGSDPLAIAKNHVEKANKAIAELDKSLGGCNANSEQLTDKITIPAF